MVKDYDIKKFINFIVNKTKNLYKGYLNETPDKVEVFRSNLEDLLLFDIITFADGTHIGTGVFDEKGIVSRDITIALETVGIRLEDVKSLYGDNRLNVNYFRCCEAKGIVIENEEKYLGCNLKDFALNLIKYEGYLTSNIDFLDFAFVLADRKSGYNQVRDNNDAYFDSELFMWNKKKEQMDEKSFSYKVLKDVIEDDSLNHYSMIERHALKKMCIFMDKLEREGLANITLREIYNMKTNLKIAKMVNPKKMQFFEDEYYKSIDDVLGKAPRINKKQLLLKF